MTRLTVKIGELIMDLKKLSVVRVPSLRRQGTNVYKAPRSDESVITAVSRRVLI